MDGWRLHVFNVRHVDLDAIVACMAQDGWAVDRLGETSARALLRCGNATLPFFVWTEDAFAVFAIVPFVRIEREVADCEPLFERLLRLNHRINLARFGVDPDGDVALSVEWRRENLDPSEVRDALDVLAFYAREHLAEVAALAGPLPGSDGDAPDAMGGGPDQPPRA